MKKKHLYIAIVLCLIVSSILLINDYFRATFVKNEKREEHHQSVLITEEEYEPVVNEDVKESIRISVFGDNLIHESILNFANLKNGGEGKRESYDKGFDFTSLYENIKPAIESSDFAICNQSSLVGANDSPSRLSGYPLFNSPSKLADDLIAVGFDAVNVANNHMLDMTEKGYQKSVQFWKKKDIVLLGGYTNGEEMNGMEQKIHRIGDFNVAILSYTGSTNGLSADKDNIPYYTLNESAILRKMLTDQVSECAELADIVIVLMNWGNGAGYEPDSNQKETARILCDAGADMIIGTGPKVIQPIERLTSTNGENETICVYSLGNTMCTMEYMENLLGGYVTFDVNRDEGKARIQNVVFHPTVVHYDENFSEISTILLSDYSEEKYRTHGSNIRKGNGEYSWFVETIEKYIPAEFQ